MVLPNPDGTTPEFRTIRGGDVGNMEFLGNGAFGEVYKARHKMYGTVAIKIVSKSTNIEDTDKQELLAEARSLARVPNKYVTLLYGVILEPGNYSLVMEFVEHGSLDKFMKKVNVPWVLKVRMIQDITCGMNFLHGFVPRIIHRDLKMPNILVSSDLHVKISDLGLSKWRTFSTKYRKTKSSANQDYCAGTVTHIPPEHFKDVSLKPDETYDVYGFGILLWEIITGKDPYKEANGNNMLISIAVMGGQRPSEEDIPPDCPVWLMELMKRCYHQDPKQRPLFPASYGEVDSRLREDFSRDQMQEAEDSIRKALRSADKATIQPPSPVLAQPSEATSQREEEIQRGVAGLHLDPSMSEPQTDAVVEEAENTADAGQASHVVGSSASNPAPLPGKDQGGPSAVPPSHPGSSPPQAAGGNAGTFWAPIVSKKDQTKNGDALRARGTTTDDKAKCPQSAEASDKPPAVPACTTSKTTTPTQDSMSPPHSPDEKVKKGKVVGPPSGEGDNESIPTRNRVEYQETTAYQETSLPGHAPGVFPGVGMHPPHYPYTMPVAGGYMIYSAPGVAPYFYPAAMQGTHMSPMNFSAAMPGATPHGGFSMVKTGTDGSTTVINMQGQMEGVQIGDKNVMYVNSSGRGQARGASGYRRVPPRRVVAGKPITTDTRVITKQDITIISENLGSAWRKLGRELSFTEGKLDAFDSDYAIDGLEEKIYQMLVAWRRINSDGATAAKLAEALCCIGKADVAVYL